MNDTDLEKIRYDNEASSILKSGNNNLIGAKSIDLIHRDCYLFYENLLNKNITKNSSVLEIACGYGRHSHIPISKSSEYTGIDISTKSIQLARDLYPSSKFIKGNFIDYDFKNKFDIIICAGSLSYFDFDIFFNKIESISNKKTKIILVDSLNDNFFYSFKRYVDYKRNKRTKSTLINMPRFNILLNLKKRYGHVNYKCFGILMFLLPFSKIVGKNIFIKMLKYTDRNFSFLKNYSYKIVIIATK